MTMYQVGGLRGALLDVMPRSREWLCTMPDPAWLAEVLEPAPSDVILGTDCLPGWSDFMAARGRRG